MPQKLPTLAELVKAQGRTFEWIAEQTGYSGHHVRKVARGEAPGSKAMHASIERLLGASYRVAK